MSGKTTLAGGNGDKRAVLLINPAFQLKFIAYTTLIVLVANLMGFGAVSYFFHKVTLLGEQAGLPPQHVFFLFIGEQRTLMTWILGVCFGFMSLSVYMLGLFFSHRVAGPLHRLKTHFTKIKDSGRMEPVQFRKGDFFPELAEHFNEMATAMQRQQPQGGRDGKTRITG